MPLPLIPAAMGAASLLAGWMARKAAQKHRAEAEHASTDAGRRRRPALAAPPLRLQQTTMKRFLAFLGRAEQGDVPGD